MVAIIVGDVTCESFMLIHVWIWFNNVIYFSWFDDGGIIHFIETLQILTKKGNNKIQNNLKLITLKTVLNFGFPILCI